jgi:hypothetical protein
MKLLIKKEKEKRNKYQKIYFFIIFNQFLFHFFIKYLFYIRLID